MAFTTFRLTQSLDTDLAKHAASEAMDVWFNPERISDICDVFYSSRTLNRTGNFDRRIGRQLHIKATRLLGIRATLSGVAQEYPAIVEVLRELMNNNYDDASTYTSESFSGFTINYMLPGQWLNIHRDPPTNKDTRLGTITALATVQGNGETVLLPKTPEKPIERLVAAAGDIVGFYNPGVYLERPQHTGHATGSTTRIVIGCQLGLRENIS